MTVGVGGWTEEEALAAITSRRDEAAPIAGAERHERIDRAQARMRALGLSALWLDGSADLEYFTGLRHGQSERLIGALLPATGELAYLAPAFEVEKLRAGGAVSGRFIGWEEDENPCALAIDALREMQAAQGVAALDPQTRFFTAEGFREAVESADVDLKFTSAAPVSSWLRQRKTPSEIALIGAAMRATVEVQAAAARIMREGITPGDVASFLHRAHRKAGFDDGARFAIALFGEATAYPHGVPNPPPLRAGDMVLVDTGGALHGYISDITRSYVFGEPTPRQREIWALEHAAQASAFEAAQPGAPCGAIDDAARGVIEAGGFGPGYAVPGLPHRTGHGVGMEVHEAPYFVKGEATPLAIGMTGSIEPTLCLYGEFGVRLEDHFHITADGPVWHTQPSPSIDDPFGLDA